MLWNWRASRTCFWLTEKQSNHGFETWTVQRTEKGRGLRFSRSDWGQTVIMS